MKKIVYLVAIAMIAMIALVGCGTSTSALVAQQQSKITAEGAREVGLPHITNFTEKRNLKMIYELRDQTKLVTYTYMQSRTTGKLIYVGETIGFGIPYGTQYSNPVKISWYHGNMIKMPQPEPNGLYPPGTAEGTWILMYDPQNDKITPAYIEPRIVVFTFKLPKNDPLLEKG